MGSIGKAMLAGLAGAMLLAAPAQAAKIIAPASAISFDKDHAGQEFVVDYTGYVNEVLQPGLSASARFRFAGSDGLSWNFEIVKMSNTSEDPVLNSRLSVYGFDTNPDAAEVTATGYFDYVREDQNVPGLGTREVCIKAVTAKSCAGGGGIGLGYGESTTEGGFNILLGQASDSLTLDNFFVRFQSVSIGSQTGLSGVGTGIVTAVPEPGQWAMLIGGFALVGGAMRAKRRRELQPA